MSMTKEELREWPKWLKPEEFTVKTIWNLYRNIVIPLDAPRIQVDEMRKAFYGGWTECFKAMTDYATHLSEDDAVKFFNKLSQENDDYVKEMMDQYLQRKRHQEKKNAKNGFQL